MKKNKNWSLRVFSQSPILLIAIAIIGFLISLVFFYPGYRSPDSEWQLCQALSQCDMDSWHPISMTVVWKVLLRVTGGFVPMMLILQLLMFWAGALLFSLWVWQRTRKWQLAILPLALGFLPNVLNIIGVIWKDVQMASALLLATGLVINTYNSKKTWLRTVGAVVSFMLLAYATSVRTNAIFAILPLIVLFVFSYNKPPKLFQKVLTIVLIVVALMSVNPLLNVIFKPQHGPSASTMYAYDIVNILPASRIADEAPEQIRPTLLALSKCSIENNQRTNLVFWNCISQNEVISSFGGDGLSVLKSYWLSTIKSYPLQYISQKIETYIQFIFSDDGQSVWSIGGDIFSQGGIYNRYNSSISRSLRSVVYGYTMDFGYKYFSFIYKPWFWLLAALTLMIYAKRLKEYRLWVYLLCASAIMYILSYAPGSLTSDYRYIYWSVVSVLIAGIVTTVGRSKYAKRNRL